MSAGGVEYPYDALLDRDRRAAESRRPRPAATGASNIYNFQYLDDTRAISEQIDRSKSAVAIGGSFIAYELAEAFASRKVETHWIMRGPHVLHRMLDEVAGELRRRGGKERRRAHALRRRGRGVRALQRRRDQSAHEKRPRDRRRVLRRRIRSHDEHRDRRRDADRDQQERHPLRRSSRNERSRHLTPPATSRTSTIRFSRCATAWERGTMPARTARSSRTT